MPPRIPSNDALQTGKDVTLRRKVPIVAIAILARDLYLPLAGKS